MSENIIEVRDLKKIYEQGNVLAVDNINFSIQKGEIFALLGPNGAGKTTTIGMLATLLPLTSGNAKVNGYDVQKDPDAVRKSIGIVFQESAVDIEMKARENLELHAILYGMGKQERRAKIDEVLKLVDLEDKANIFVKNYSGGMRRRLEIARGLIHQPSVLFLDEPTLGLDPQTRRKIWEKIRVLNRGPLKMTILITTHYMEEADELADRICIMDHGKIIAMDTSQNLKHKLSGDIVDITLEKSIDHAKILQLIGHIKSIEGVKNINLGNSKDKGEKMEMPAMPQNLPGNINPEMLRARMKQMMSDPKKMIKAWKKFPMSSQMFLNAPLDRKKKIASMFTGSELLNEVPNAIREEIIKIQKGEIDEQKVEGEPQLSISCENGGKVLPRIVQRINDDGLEIKTVNMHQPTLEDVFIFFTGDAIREESADRVKNIKKMIQMRQLRK